MISAAVLTACGGTSGKNTNEKTDNAISSDTENNGNGEPDNISGQVILGDSGDAAGNVDGLKLDTIPDENMLQQLYDKAPGYQYLALGYYRDLDNPTMVRDGYVPFAENFVQEDTGFLKSAAHGVSIRLYMVKADNATNANKECVFIYNENLKARGISAEFQDALSFDNDTLALSIAVYQDENEETIVAFLYSDIRDNGTVYMCAEIEMNETEFDDSTLALVEEMDDAYSMTFSSMFYE